MSETGAVSQSLASHYSAPPLIESMGRAGLLNPHFCVLIREDPEDGWIEATRVGLAPINHHLPVAFPSASLPSHGGTTANPTSRTRLNLLILLPVLSEAVLVLRDREQRITPTLDPHYIEISLSSARAFGRRYCCWAVPPRPIQSGDPADAFVNLTP